MPLWSEVLGKFAGRPGLLAVEVGSFEGRATLWFLEAILTAPSSRIICLDPFENPLFVENTTGYREKVVFIQERSQVALRGERFHPYSVDFIYVDGSHKAANVLEDAVLSFRLVRNGGVLIFDDYHWHTGDELAEPRIAIDAFLDVFRGQYTLLHKGWQVVIEKRSPKVR